MKLVLFFLIFAVFSMDIQKIELIEDALHQVQTKLEDGLQDLRKLRQTVMLLKSGLDETKTDNHKKLKTSPKINPTAFKLTEFFLEPEISMKMTMIDRQLSNLKITGRLNVFPNESSAKLFCDMETNAYSWEDPDNLVRCGCCYDLEACRNENNVAVKEIIVSALQQKGQAMTNTLFDLISDWWIQSKCLPIVRQIATAVLAKVDVDRRSQKSRTPLMLAIRFDGNLAAKLIEKGAEVNAKDSYKITALHDAASCGNERLVAKLIEKGAKVDARNCWQQTALHNAARGGHPACTRVLLNKGANVNAQDETSKKTPLMMAAQDKDTDVNDLVDVVWILLGAGANTKIKDWNGQTATTSSWFGRKECIAAIQAHEEQYFKK